MQKISIEGTAIARDENGFIRISDDRGRTNITLVLDGSAEPALRAFMQAEDDERLGRWRWPTNPDYVVYPRDEHGQTVVVHEKTGHNVTFIRGRVNPFGSDFARCAIAFFDANPERKPWLDAEIGEVWELTVSEWGNRTDPFYVTTVEGASGPYKVFMAIAPDYKVSYLGREATVITDARRIYPEDAS